MRNAVCVLLICAGLDAWAADREAPFPARVLPDRTVGVVSASDPATLFSAAAESPLGQLLGTDDQLVADLVGRLARLQVLTSLITSLPGPDQQPLLEGGCALALLPADPNAPATSHLPLVALFDLSKLTEEARAALERSVVAAARLALHDKATLRKIGAHAYRIELGERPDQRFGLSFADGVMRLGAEADLARLDAAGTLARTPAFLEAQRATPAGPGLRAFVNVAELLAELDRRRPNAARAETLRGIGSGDVTMAALHTGIQDGQMIDTLHLAMRSPRLSWLRFLPKTQRPLKAADFVPEGFDLLISIDLGSGEKVWEAVRAIVGEVGGPEGLETLDNWIEGLEMPFGVDLRQEVFASMAGEVFFAIDLDALSDTIAGEGINARQTPYLFGIRTTQQDVLAGALNRLLQSDIMWDTFNIERQSYIYGGWKLVRLSSCTEPRIDHGFGFVSGYLLMSPRHNTLEAAVDAFTTGRNLAACPGYRAAAQALPASGNIEVYARTSVLCRELARAYLPWLARPLRGRVERMLPGLNSLGDSMARVIMHEGGITAKVASPCGAALALASAREIKAAAIRRKLHLTREALKKTEAALERYYLQHRRYPARLDALVPELLPELPADPFAPYVGMPLRYRAAGREPQGYLLAANGPDRRADFDVNKQNPLDWARKQKGPDTAGLDQLKALLYQYQPEKHADERGLNDEGDIVAVCVKDGQEREDE